MPSWSDVRVLYVKELRSALRETHIVVNSLLIPIFLYPVLLWLAYTALAFVSGQSQAMTSRVMLDGLPAEHHRLLRQIEADGAFELTAAAQPATAIRAGRLDVLAEFLPAGPAADLLPGNFAVRLAYDRSKERSVSARARVAAAIEAYRAGQVEAKARRAGVPLAELQVVWVESVNLASGRQMGQFVLGLMLPLFLVIMLSLGAFYPAIDATAGEREHSTWETLMTVATPRINLVVAKYLYVATLSSVAGLLNLAAMSLTMKTILTPLLKERAAELTFRLPWGAIPAILAGTVLLALFVSAGMMILASFARTFKEAQSLVGPFYLVVFLPLLFLQVPDLEFSVQLAAIPVVNVSLMFREAIAGRYDWPLIGLTVAVEAACIAGALRVAAAVLRQQDFVLGGHTGGFGRFLKRRWSRRGREEGRT